MRGLHIPKVYWCARCAATRKITRTSRSCPVCEGLMRAHNPRTDRRMAKARADVARGGDPTVVRRVGRR